MGAEKKHLKWQQTYDPTIYTLTSLLGDRVCAQTKEDSAHCQYISIFMILLKLILTVITAYNRTTYAPDH